MIRGICRLTVALGLAVAVTSGAFAGPVADRAAEAEAKLSAGDPAAALTAFDAATEAFWNASPLQFRVATFADSVAGFARYAPRADSTFHTGDSVTIYLEPVGYGFVSDRDSSRVSFQSGVEIRQGDIVLGKTDDLGKLDWEGREKNYAVHAAISLTLPDLKPGDYTMLLTLTDDASEKAATTTLPFTIAE